jgi:PAS domain-containing protein
VRVAFRSGNNLRHQYATSLKRRKIEDQLFQEKEKALITLESIADGVITTDSSGNIEYLNTAAELFTGWTLAEAVDKPFLQVYKAHDEVHGTFVNGYS